MDFNDPNRPKTCSGGRFPILPVNQVDVSSGIAGKPIYQMSKMVGAAAFQRDSLDADRGSYQRRTTLPMSRWCGTTTTPTIRRKARSKHLKVADIFGGGGTYVGGRSRVLGMQMIGNDLNPVAWFVPSSRNGRKCRSGGSGGPLADIEDGVKPQIMPYYYCDGPAG